jgi:lipoate-protein ligase A
MALDEALLEAVASIGQPVLRFYSWTEPAATFGYFQKFAEIERTTHLRPLIRRPTGGGLVPHYADWTYSVVIPPTHPWHALNAVDSYRRMHEWIRAAFAKLGVATELADCCRKSAPGQCFVGWEKFDVLWQGRKIAGAAQRRNKLGLLIQGSVQPPPVRLAKVDWEEAMCRSHQREEATGQMTWEAFEPDTALRARAEALTQEKYSQAAFSARL